MAKKKRAATLPRVTVLAMRRQDLVAFVSAVETLRLLVEDLRLVVGQIRAKKPKPAPAPAPAVPPTTA